MPANYAHYRFGLEMLEQMPGDLRRPANRFRRLYDVGLHGADLFYYYNPVMSTKTGALAEKYHDQSGVDFFGRICRGLRMTPSEAGEAYLYGLLAHYALDSLCRPYLKQLQKKGMDIAMLEAEFDCFLLETDGKLPPNRQNFSNHMKLTPGECETAAKFYSGVKAAHVRTCLRNMAWTTKTLAMGDGASREMVKKGVGWILREHKELVIPPRTDPSLAQYMQELLKLYEQAGERFAALLVQLAAHMTYIAPLGEDFTPDFG